MSKGDTESKSSSQDEQRNKNTGHSEVETGGGSYLAGNVTVNDGDFVGRDKIESGAVIQIGTIEIHFNRDEPTPSEEILAAIQELLKYKRHSKVRKDQALLQLIRDWREVFQDDHGLPQAMMTVGNAEITLGLDDNTEQII